MDMKIKMDFGSKTKISFGTSRLPITKTQLRSFIDKGYSVEQIAEAKDLTPMYIQNLISKFGFELKSPEIVKNLEEQIIALKNNRASVREIVEKTGESVSTVKAIIKRLFKNSYVKAKQATRVDSVENIQYINRKNIYDVVADADVVKIQKLKESSYRVSQKLEMCKKVLEMQAQGLSIDEIAKALNKNELTIKRYLKFCEQKNFSVKNLK